MGFFDFLGGEKSTTQTTTIPELTEEEQAIQSLITDTIMPAILEKAGFETTKITSKFEDTDEFQNFQSRRERLLEEKQSLIDTGDGPTTALTPSERLRLQREFRPGESIAEKQERIAAIGQDPGIQSRISAIDQRLETLDRDEAVAFTNFKPTVSIESRRIGTPEEERIRKRFGEDSQEFKDAQNKAERESITLQNQKNQITKLFMERAIKFISGDFSITAEQEELIQSNMAGTRAALDDMFDNIIAESETSKKTLLETSQETFNNFVDKVEETGINLNNALDVIGTQINRTGRNMEQALADTVAVNKQLLEMGIQDLTGELTKQMTNRMNQLAVTLGRDPSDPEFTQEIQKTVAVEVGKEIKRGVLNLNLLEAQGRLSIQERTGSKLEELGFRRFQVDERTGRLTEAAILQQGAERFGIEERGARTREGAVRGRAAAEVGLEEQAQKLRFDIGTGLAPTQVGLGVNVAQFQEALSQQELSNLGAGINVAGSTFDRFARERFAQPTTTSTTKDPFGFGDVLQTAIGGTSLGFQIAGLRK